MAHCPYAQLEDLEDVLATVRQLPLFKERSPGVFYVKSVPFLHFHVDKAGDRWADVKVGKDWVRVDAPPGCGARQKAALRRELTRRYTLLTNA